MKTVTNDFKKELTTIGRQYKNKINLYGDRHLATQDNKLILTQDNLILIAENTIKKTLKDDMLFNINLSRKGKILSTMMKELDFESYEDIEVGNIVEYLFGLKTNFENDEYEWINYGKYIIYSKEFNEDTKTYTYVCYDYMLKTMIPIDDRTIIQNVTIETAINNLVNKFGLEATLNTTKYPNLLKVINENAFNNINATYRDVLDMICQAVGATMIANNENLIFKSLKTNPVDTIDKKFLKDINVSFGKKYGPINSLVLSRSEQTDNIYRQDTQSIEENGLTEFKIKDNLILLYNDREEYIDNIFNQINGVEYYINDFSSTGIGYLEFLDFYNIQIDENIYKCLMLDSDFKVKNGISEEINTEEPEETVTEYTTAGKTDKEVSFIVDKQTASINAKVTKGEVINEINLDETGASINAEKISLEGYTTINDNFKIDLEGNMICKNATIENGIIEMISDTTRPKIIINNSSASSIDTSTTLSGNGFSVEIDDLNNAQIGTAKSISSDGQSISIISTLDYSNSNKTKYRTVLNPDNFIVSKYKSNGDFQSRSMIDYEEVRSPSIVDESREELKKNFEKLKSGLEIIKNIDIYKYNFKFEDDNCKKHIGFVIGDNYKYSKELTSKDNQAADIYSFASVCCKAIQEQQEIIETLQEEINKLKEDK